MDNRKQNPFLVLELPHRSLGLIHGSSLGGGEGAGLLLAPANGDFHDPARRTFHDDPLRSGRVEILRDGRVQDMDKIDFLWDLERAPVLSILQRD